MKKNILKVIALMLVSAFVLAACGNGGGNEGNVTPPTVNNEGGNQGGDTPGTPPTETTRTHLNWALGAMPPSLDSTMALDMPGSQVGKLIHQTLFTHDHNMEVVGLLATDWEFIDAQTLRVWIREGVRFHDGSPLTAEDVAWSLERAGRSPHVAMVANMIDSVTVEDEYQVLIELEIPFAAILSNLAHTSTSIKNRAAIESVGEEVHQFAPVGLGPFRVTEYVSGDRIELVRFDDFWGTAPVLESITVRAIPDGSMRAIELETGNIDLAYGILPADFNRLRNDPSVNVMSTFGWQADFIGFNLNRAPFDDVRVRQAILYAIDEEAMVEAALQGTSAPVNGPLSDLVWGSISAELPGRPFNPERARELLAEAGLADGFSTSIWTNQNEVRIDMATILQSDLAMVGIDVDIEIIEWGAYLELTAAGEHDMFILGWVASTGDADYGLFPTHHSSAHGATGNRSFFANAEVDRLLEEGRAEIDPQRRLEIYAEAQRIIFEEAPMFYTHQSETLIGTSPDLRGLQLRPNLHHTLTTIFFE
ncbi:MAG: ABC transporter substrate-binding protein [Defluviitaleaceae bacterium]|nr:ABC transporter substrate-binding protein [Defluviitaleaceae bacterium]